MAALVLLMVCSSCVETLKGTFYLSDEARAYQIDTTITSIKLIDNFGISEEFYLDNSVWYSTHNYFHEWGTDGEAWGETYGVAYSSTVNGFFFMFVLRADVENTDLEIEWNQKDRLVYNFGTKMVESGIIAKIRFHDSLTVRNISYRNVIEVDYSDNINAIDIHTPVKTFISGNKGLIKMERKDNIILERIE